MILVLRVMVLTLVCIVGLLRRVVRNVFTCLCEQGNSMLRMKWTELAAFLTLARMTGSWSVTSL